LKANRLFSTLRMLSIVFIILLTSLKILAQENSNVTEPPLPIYVVCPYHEDSLKAAFSGSGSDNGSALSLIAKRYDTLQTQVLQSSAENTAHFTWLYTLIALLGAMIIVLLFSTARIRKELMQIKRIEHQQTLTAVSSQEIPSSLPVVQDTLNTPEPKESITQRRTRKVRTRKSNN
jgi:hypothetical protein